MRHIPSHPCCNHRGSVYVILMFVVVIMTIGVTVAAKQWKTVVQREKEADLLAHGIEIQTAIASYNFIMIQKAGTVTGAPVVPYPLTMEELTKAPKPYLRKLYKDPITGGDWEYIREPVSGGIKGVRSSSTVVPMKQHQFPPAVAHFEGLAKYNEWLFQYPSASTLQAAHGLPGQPVPGASQPLQPGQTQQGFPGQPGAQPLPPGQAPQGFPGPPQGFPPPSPPGGSGRQP